MAKVVWKKDGWTSLQEAKPEKHIASVNCRAENGNVVEVRVRPSRGEEEKVEVFLNGKRALPMPIEEFQKYYDKYELEFR